MYWRISIYPLLAGNKCTTVACCFAMLLSGMTHRKRICSLCDYSEIYVASIFKVYVPFRNISQIRLIKIVIHIYFITLNRAPMRYDHRPPMLLWLIIWPEPLGMQSWTKYVWLLGISKWNIYVLRCEIPAWNHKLKPDKLLFYQQHLTYIVQDTTILDYDKQHFKN